MATPNYTSWPDYLKKLKEQAAEGGKKTYAPDPKPAKKKKKAR